MKKIIFLIAFLSVYLLNAQTWIYDKNNPEYNQNDWRAPIWGFCSSVDGALDVHNTISPFYHYDETNLDFLANGEDSDFQPTEGWVLMYANLGDRTISPSNIDPKVVLYSKERGIIRFFFKKMISSNHTKAYAQLSASSNSGLLSTITGEGEQIYALDQRINNNSSTVVKYLEHYSNTWMFADFYVAYDDIIRNSDNLLYFKARATDNTQVNLNLEGRIV